MLSRHSTRLHIHLLLTLSAILLFTQELLALPPTPESLSSPNSLTPRAPNIKCFDFPEEPTAYRKTSLDGCRPTLNTFKTFPAWRLVQDFLEGFFPLKPDKPPYYVALSTGDCSVEISSHEQPKVKDKFSFQEVKDLAQQILEECQEPEEPGRGGEVPIGSKGIWKVTVRGWKAPDGLTIVDGWNNLGIEEEIVMPVEASK